MKSQTDAINCVGLQPLHTSRFLVSNIEDRVRTLQEEGNLSAASKGGFWDEFEELQQQECKHLYSRKEGTKDGNKSKNRYKNILPCEYYSLYSYHCQFIYSKRTCN